MLFAAALGVRLICLHQVWDVPFMQTPTVDAQAYDEWGQRIAAGDWWGSGVFFMAPLYPYFVGAVYSIFGRSLPALHVIQMLIGAGACVLAYLAGRRLFHHRAGLASGWLLALYAPAIHFDGVMHKEGLALFLFMLVIALLAGAFQRATIKAFLAAGLVAGLLALTRENLIILLLLAPAWAFLSTSMGPLKRRAQLAVVFAGGVLLVLLPVAVRNYVVGSTFSLSQNFGQNFYFGNNPDATGLYEPLVHNQQDPLSERRDAERLAERQAGRDLTSGEVSSFWFRRGLHYIFEHPVDWLKLTAYKALLTWNAFEVPDTEDVYLYAERSMVLGALTRFLHFGVLAPLGLAGAVLAWRYRSSATLLYLLLAGVTASVAIFFVFARYRFPLVAPLSLLAGLALVEIVSTLRGMMLGVPPQQAFSCEGAREKGLSHERVSNENDFPAEPCSTAHHREPNPPAAEWATLAPSAGRATFAAHAGGARLLAAIALGAASFAVINRSMLDENAYRSVAYVNLAGLYQQRGDLQSGLAAGRRALELYPENALAHLQLGSLSVQANAFNDAEKHLRRAIGIDPKLHAAHLALADVYQTQGRTADAAGQLSAAVSLMPGDASLHHRLARTLMDLGDEAAAARELVVAQRLFPGLRARLTPEELALLEQAKAVATDPLALARQALRAGEYGQAIRLYEEAASRLGDDPALHHEWAKALVAVENFPAAAHHFERALSLAPQFAEAHNDFGQLLSDRGDFDLAMQHYRAAIAAKPEMIPAHYNLATTLAATGRIEEATQAMENCLAIARGAAPADIVERIEDRLSRLRKELANAESKN